MSQDWNALTIPQLRQELDKRGVEHKSLKKKAELVEKLSSLPQPAAADTTVAPPASDKAATAAVAAPPTVTAPAATAPAAPATNGSEHAAHDATSAATDEAPAKKPAKIGAVPADDINARKARAERFGIELRLSDDERKQMRAGRFNLPSEEAESKKKDARSKRFGDNKDGSSTGASEEDKAKIAARAARFGIPVNTSTSNGGGASQKRKIEATTVDPAEAEKLKKRAARFGQAK